MPHAKLHLIRLQKKLALKNALIHFRLQKKYLALYECDVNLKHHIYKQY